MEKQAHPQQLRKFLPHYFKYIGRGVMLLGFILFFSKAIFENINPYIAFGLLLIGSLLFAFAKEKVENDIFMKLQQNQPGQPPFPNYFKKIGAGTVLFTIAVLMPASIWLKKSNPEAFENDKQLFGILFIDIIYIGFLLYVGAKEKIEDELIVKIRLQSLALAFIMGILHAIIQPIFHYNLNNQFENSQNVNIILFMLIFYTIFFHFSKKNR
jgi:hypothetical protein